MRTYLLTALAATASFSTFAANFPDSPHLYVQGQAQVTTAPDQVTLNMSIIEIEKDLMQAKQKADQSMAKAIKIAKQAGAEDKKIYASQINIHRETEYNRNTNKQEFVGYRVTRSLSVTLNDLQKYPVLLQQLVNAGINQVQSPQFSSSQYQQLHAKAQKLAIEDAKNAAKELASAYDVDLKGLYSTSMAPINSGPQPYMRTEAMKLSAASDSASGQFVPDSYQTGEITISASSYAVYLID